MAFAVFGQTDTTMRAPRWLSIGGALGGGLTSEFGQVVVPEIADCDSLDAGSGASWSLMLLADLPIADRLSAHARAGLILESGELRTRARLPIPVATNEGRYIDGTYDDVLAFDRTMIAALLGVRYDVVDRLELGVGIETLARLGGSQTFRQEAISPPELLFAGRRINEIRSGSIVTHAPFALAIVGSAGYRLPISRSAWLVPELSSSLTLTSLATGGSSWRRLRLAAGASLRFDLLETPPRIDTPIIAARVPVLRPVITTSPTTVEVRVDEYDSIEALPLLTQVFFSEGSSALPSRYRLLDDTAATSFTESQLVGTALDVYYHLLNVIGLRMSRSPEASLAISGHRNGREGEAGLSARRAEAIRHYLVDTWRISRRRLRALGGGLPESPARENVSEGFEENARAAIEASDPNITKPVFRRHVQRVANPPRLIFYPRAEAEAGLRSWRLDIVSDTALWRRFEGTGTPPDSLVWDWRSDARELPTIPMALSYELVVADTTGQVVATPRYDVKVEYRSLQEKLENRQNDTVIESYSLLLFNFDSPSVSPADRELLQAIAGTVRKEAIVRITGYTDTLGLESHNRDLAQRRANETARLLREMTPAGTMIVVDPNGGERERFPNDTPEGRAHSRTVVIEVRTPATED